MDKNSFITLLRHFNGTSIAEAEEVLLLEQEYPYCQVLHALAARVAQDHQLQQSSKHLQLAAVYSADRAVLKNLITHEKAAIVVRPDLDSKAEELQPEAVAAGEPSSAISEPQPVTRDSAAPATDVTSEDNLKSSRPSVAQAPPPADDVDIADEVMHDLEKLNELKHNFEMLLVEYSEVPATRPPKQKLPKAEPAKEKEQDEQYTKIENDTAQLSPREKAKNRRARIIELAKAMGTTDSILPEPPKAHRKKGKNVKEQPDELIEEIKLTKLEIVPDNERQKEQLHIIDQFILAQPSITSGKDRQHPPALADLTPIRSGEFGDNIISETLVEILLKQGKKDKAIEVLKKLIWKYPQKKTYFASQIEELKK